VGDSRAYRYRHGRLTPLTVDDDLLALENAAWPDKPTWGRLTRERKREIRRKLSRVTDGSALATEEQWFWGQRGMITNILGRGQARVKLQSLVVQPKDIFLLTTDGVHDNLTPRQLSALLSKKGQDIGALATAITQSAAAVSRAHLFRSKPDDITALVIACF
jgi:serine/threonine protein phosphatase PrpC